ALKIAWNPADIVKPARFGVQTFKNHDLAQIASMIDWVPFFPTWELKGKYPKIFDDPKIGVEAKKVFNDAQVMLKTIIKEKWLKANAVVGLFPANSVGDDVEVYADDSRKKIIATFYTLRQQSDKQDGRPNYALSDFIASKDSGLKDYIGAFAVSAGFGVDEKAAEFLKQHDDYNAIMIKALADRLAEAFAELMHKRVRRELWGYASHETLNVEELIQEKYQGVRPAPGYPSQPDHTEKRTIFDLLKAADNTGIQLTESLAMWPASSVSGLYLAHPESKYFALDKIGKDQAEDYARRKGMPLAEIEKWLAPNLVY
ncbi:MAG: methionine synthase, partial [Candidatus Omnitrophica bacterium CG12_big_fil_rev_8_21_14_0_65_50_5]